MFRLYTFDITGLKIFDKTLIGSNETGDDCDDYRVMIVIEKKKNEQNLCLESYLPFPAIHGRRNLAIEKIPTLLNLQMLKIPAGNLFYQKQFPQFNLDH